MEAQDAMYLVGGLAALVGLAALAVLLARVWRYVLLLAGLAVGGLIAYAVAQQATATRQVATTATVAAAGSAAGNVAAAALAVLLVLLLLCGGGYVLVLRARLRHYQEQGAGVGRPVAGVQMQEALQALVQLEVLRALAELRSAPRLVYGQPDAGALDTLDAGDGEGEVWPWWGL